MNWLAHIVLSKRDIDYQLGNLLADPLKGRLWQGASEQLHHGVAMHKSIDHFTDTHKLFLQSKRRLGSKGYLKGVVVDVLYDHFLALRWDKFVEPSFELFIEQFNLRSKQSAQNLPNHAGSFVNALVASDRFFMYSTFEGLESTLNKIDLRLSHRVKRKDTTSSYVEAIRKNYELLDNDFCSFFPELVTHFKTHELGSNTDHFLK